MAFLIPARLFIFFAIVTFSLALFSNADPCSNDFQRAIHNYFNVTYQNCLKKTPLTAQMAWNYDKKSRLLDIAFGTLLSLDSGWLAWGLNPNGPQMVGTHALIGIKHRNNSKEIHAYDITFYTKHGCDLLPDTDNTVAQALGARNYRFEYVKEINYYVIQATINLPKEYNDDSTNVVWQIGEDAVGAQPLMHPMSLKHLSTAETVNIVNGRVISKSPHLRRSLVKAHGTLSIVGWGTLLPCGVIISRYFRGFPINIQQWQKFHTGFQMAGYTVGSTGWAIGMWLGNTSKYYTFNIHRNLGIIIFTFSTIQMLAWMLKPGDNAEFRAYWNMYHHFLGYSLLVLISVNIFYGITIVAPVHAWKWSYIGVLAALGAMVVVLEAFTWIKFLLRLRRPKSVTDE